MKITLTKPEIELEVNKADTPTGIGWCIIMPDGSKIVVELRLGKWETADLICDEFVQSIGIEISRILEAEKLSDHFLIAKLRAKRERILKYFLI